MRHFRVTVNGETFLVEVEEIKERANSNGASTKAIGAASNPVQPPTSVPAIVSNTSGGANSENNVTAPMPGNILGIQVKQGEAVKTGQVLLVLEAMKMENEIVAPRDGIVKRVHVTVGQSVNTGDPLVSLE